MNAHGILAFAAVFALCVAAAAAAAQEGRGGGFNDNIDWVEKADWAAAKARAKEENKPILLLIHRTWCGACKSLKPLFSASQEIEELSGDFVMVQSADEEQFKGDAFGPDGGYVPRILFFGPDGALLRDVVGANPKYKHFHPEPGSILRAMREAANAVGEKTPDREEL